MSEHEGEVTKQPSELANVNNESMVNDKSETQPCGIPVSANGGDSKVGGSDVENPLNKNKFEHFEVAIPPKETYYQKTINEQQRKQHFQFSWTDFRRRNFYISGALDLEYFVTTRGAENVHIYLWIAKDLCWTQDLRVPSMIFGVGALAWCALLLYHAITDRNAEEVYQWVAFFLWLSANFLWMYGEVYNGDDDYVLPKAAIMMQTAIAWIFFFHLVLRPFKLIEINKYTEQSLYHVPLTPRISYFKYWRQYEHVHTLFWLSKDLSWNESNPYTWVLSFIPTFLIAGDFIATTFCTKCMMEDTMHYIAQVIWIIGNMLWAMSNVYIQPDDDSAKNFLHMDREARASMRTWASWALFVAFWPIIILYAVWIPLTIKERFDTRSSVVYRPTRRNSIFGW